MTLSTKGGDWDGMHCGRSRSDNNTIFDIIAKYRWLTVGKAERQIICELMGNRTLAAIKKRLANMKNALTAGEIAGKQYRAFWYRSEFSENYIRRINNIRAAATRVGIVFDKSKVLIGKRDVYAIVGRSSPKVGGRNKKPIDRDDNSVTFFQYEQERKKFKYSEIFHSFQGEGTYTGRSTAWIRFFLCNLQCDGFGQTDPTDPSTYVLPYKDLDVSKFKNIEDLPVFAQGCDSSYTWAKKYRHLARDENASGICDNIELSLAHQSNPDGRFFHPQTRQQTHMAFTGGEPMLNQPAIQEILREFNNRNNFPRMVTVETNGTQLLSADMFNTISAMYDKVGTVPKFHGPHTVDNHSCDSNEWFWSVSPKLWSTSGEPESKAIKPAVLAQYANASNHGQIKYVVNGTPESWDEVDRYTRIFREAGVFWDVFIMVVGATKEDQEEDQIADIAMEAMKRGYHFSGRLHAHIFGNVVGT